MSWLVLSSITYFYYHWHYFDTTQKLVSMRQRRIGLILLSFTVNFLFFCLCSVLEFSLIVNWSLFFILLFFETLFYNGGNGRSALFCALMGILYGLVVNIFCRSVVAIALRLPLQAFNNQVSSAANIKEIPVCAGFLLAGLVIQYSGRPALIERLRLLLSHPRHQRFLLEIMTWLFFYLSVNLLLYSTPLNDLLLKLWSIKSCLFTAIGFYIAVRYTVRICELEDYREKNRRVQLELEEQSREEERLREQAALDPLTGLYNRQYAEETILAMMRERIRFTVCFLDLDGLKYVNDRFGHEEGDRYLLTVTEYIHRSCRKGMDLLFRYGGDEFLIVFQEASEETAACRANEINENLRRLAAVRPSLYPLSLSYGVVGSASFSALPALLDEADRRMYEQKRIKKANRG